MSLWNIFAKDTHGALKKYASRVANKRAQAPDRWEAIKVLAEMKNEEAVAALLVRFTYTTDPSITDQEEKDAVFDAVLDAKEVSVAPVKRFLARAESLGWPLKLLEALLNEQEVLSELLAVLEKMDTEYERDPQRKIQILVVLEERSDPRIGEVVERFVEDVNETARFHAVGVLLAQSDSERFQERLMNLLGHEESLRVRARILDGFAHKGWSVKPLGKALNLPVGYRLNPHGVPQKA
ncbi:MAG: HEAT repeat domain-containing protein [Myxococcales bacterium]|nr:HEAT repeat domain-containing protein [Myxococcales bacterium]MCB9708412.1 HEAT repeat domain-containing protein [Myxococcales bacterium]